MLISSSVFEAMKTGECHCADDERDAGLLIAWSCMVEKGADFERAIPQRPLQRLRLILWRSSRPLRNWLLVTVTICILNPHVQ